MTKEQVLEYVPSGWFHVVDRLFEIITKHEYLKINSISRDHGLFRINFEDIDDEANQYVANAIKFKMERDCVHICEGCGSHGMRRKVFSPPRVYCTKCVVIAYNEYVTEDN